MELYHHHAVLHDRDHLLPMNYGRYCSRNSSGWRAGPRRAAAASHPDRGFRPVCFAVTYAPQSSNAGPWSRPYSFHGTTASPMPLSSLFMPFAPPEGHEDTPEKHCLSSRPVGRERCRGHPTSIQSTATSRVPCSDHG